MFNTGDKVKMKNPKYGDDEAHTILNVQKTHGDVLYFLHYYSWVDEDDLELVKDNMIAEDIKVGNKYKWEDSNLCQDIFTIVGNKKDIITYKYEEDGYNHKESVDSFIMDNTILIEMSEPTKEDIVQQPAHYNSTKITALQVIDDWNLGFHLGNVVKYIARNELKGNQVADLKKAANYLQMFIDKVEGSGESK